MPKPEYDWINDRYKQLDLSELPPTCEVCGIPCECCGVPPSKDVPPSQWLREISGSAHKDDGRRKNGFGTKFGCHHAYLRLHLGVDEDNNDQDNQDNQGNANNTPY